MTPYAASEITKDRLRIWQKRNQQANYCATPAILLSINHEEGKSGQMVINTVENLSDEDIIKLLEQAILLLKANDGKRSTHARSQN